MCVSYFPFHVLISVLISVLVATGVHGGSVYVNCPGNLTEFGPFIPCDYDCITNHAASTGTCVLDANNADTNCICVDSGNHPYSGSCTYVNNNIQIPGICQCASSPVGLLDSLYEGVCNGDCQCEHGALGGTCDWEARACMCDYEFPNGGSWSPSMCEAQALVTVAQTLANALDALG